MLDKTDSKILHELDLNPRITSSQLGKKLRISQQVADYRLKRLIKKDIIYAFGTVINFFAMGYSFYRVFLTFDIVSKEKKKEIMEYLKNHYCVYWAAIIGGKFDLVIGFIVRDYQELDKILNELFIKFKGCFKNHEVLPIIRMDQYKYNLFSKQKDYSFILVAGNKSDIKLDSVDYKILHLIKNNPRASYLELGKKLNLNYNTIKYRIQNLMKNKIILGYKIFVRPQKLGLQSYKLLISLKNYTKKDEEKIFAFALQNDNITYALKYIGKWMIDFEIEIESFEKLQELIINLKNKFPIIDDFEILPIFKDLRVDFFPMSKLYISKR